MYDDSALCRPRPSDTEPRCSACASTVFNVVFSQDARFDFGFAWRKDSPAQDACLLTRERASETGQAFDAFQVLPVPCCLLAMFPCRTTRPL